MGDNEFVQLGTLKTDLHEFRASCEAADWISAANWYGGPLLEGLHIDGCTDFHHWVDAVRVDLEDEAIRALYEPLPQETASALHERIRPGNRPALALPHPAGPIFLGRRHEADLLLSRWEEAANSGSSVVAAISGPAGIGKTALCVRFAKRTVLRGGRATVITGFEAERRLPFGIVSQLVKQIADLGTPDGTGVSEMDIIEALFNERSSSQEVLADAPALSKLSETPRIDLQIAAALTNLLGVCCKGGPLLIVVDDAHWADQASTAILHYVSRACSHLPLMFVFAFRTGELSEFPLTAWAPDPYLRLEGLNEEETRRLIQHLNPNLQDRRVLRDIQQLSLGNPFFVKTLASRAPSDSEHLPLSAIHYLAERMKALGTEAKKLGAALAVLGRPASIERLQSITELEPTEFESAVENLSAQGYAELVRESGKIGLKHSLIGDVFLRMTSIVDRARLHRRAGLMLRHEGGASAVVAMQLATSGKSNDAFHAAMIAAHTSYDLFAFRESEYFYRVAVAHSYSPHTEARSRAGLADLLIQRGDTAEAQMVLSAMGSTERLSSKVLATLQILEVIATIFGSASTAELQNAFSLGIKVEQEVPVELACNLYFRVGRTSYQQGLSSLAHSATERAENLLSSIEPNPARDRLRMSALALLSLCGPAVHDVGLIANLIERNRDNPQTLVTGLGARAAISHLRGRSPDARRDLANALATCERFGLVVEGLSTRANLAVVLTELGDYEAATEMLEYILRMAPVVPAAEAELANSVSNLQIVAFEQAAYQEAIRIGREPLNDPNICTRTRIALLSVTGLSQLEMGMLPAAIESQAEIKSLADWIQLWSHDISYAEILFARLAVIGGDSKSGIQRLEEKIEAFTGRDAYCAARMQVEAFRIRSKWEPALVLAEAESFREHLLRMHAAPLVNRLDDIVARCRIRQAD